jgi:hypothetical protein
VSDEAWRRVAGRKWDKAVLCIWCFDGLAFKKKVRYTLEVLCFVGRAGFAMFRARDRARMVKRKKSTED